MRRDLLFTLLVLTLNTGCMSYIRQSMDVDMAPDVTVSPADGIKHDFGVSVASDLPRLLTAMGNPSAYHEIYFSDVHLDAEVYAGASNREIAKWTMNWDGSITHRSHNAPTDRFDCLDRQPFIVDEATIARLPEVIQDASNHTGNLDNPKFSSVTIRRATGQFWWCGDVQIAVNFDSDCGEVYKDDDGDQYFDCPTRDVIYDTNGKFLWTTTDLNTRPAF